MRILFTSLALLLLSSPSYPESIEGWNVEYRSESRCLPNSDVCHQAIAIVDSSGKVSELKVTGPVLLAIKNRQIVSCESNAILATEEAKIFDLAGRLVATVNHRGYLRECGITPDGSLYWFHYNEVIESKPMNVVVVVSSRGAIVYEKVLSKGEKVEFSYGKDEYELDIQEPELPG